MAPGRSEQPTWPSLRRWACREWSFAPGLTDALPPRQRAAALTQVLAGHSAPEHAHLHISERARMGLDVVMARGLLGPPPRSPTT